MSLALHYNFAVDKSLVARIGPTLGIVRATEKRVYGSDGLLDTVASGVAGFDHNPASLGSLGLSIEEARTNVCKQSEDFSTTWTKGAHAAAIVGNETTAPDGASTADKIVDDSAGGSGGSVYVTQIINGLALSTPHSISCYAKADGLDWSRFLGNAWGALNISQYYDLTNVVVGTPGADVDDSGIVPGRDDWYRGWLTFTTDGADANGQLRIYVADGDGDNSVTRDGTSSIFGWGTQIEAGAFRTSYIPALAASVTRNKDDVSVVDVTWLGSGNSLYVQFKTGNIDNDSTVLSIHDGTADERIALEITGGDLHFIGVDGSVTQWDISTALAADTMYRVAVAWAVNDAVLYLDGAQIDTDAGASLPTVTTLNVGSDHADAEQLNGSLLELGNDNTRLPNAELQSWSTGSFPGTKARSGLGLAFGKMGMR